MEFGVRINSRLYFKFIIDMTNGDISVIGEAITDEGVKIELTGNVVWEEGE